MPLLEANGNPTRMLEFVALGDEERKLVEQGTSLNEAVLSRVADEPTPAGPTSRELPVGKRKPLPLLKETFGLVQQESARLDLTEQEDEVPGEVVWPTWKRQGGTHVTTTSKLASAHSYAV